jgi:hypothetical protein
MKKIYNLILLLCSVSVLTAQIDQPSVGASYANSTFYNLEDGNTTSATHTEWDIAFNVTPFNLGIIVNEGVGLSFTAPLSIVELFQTNSTDFATADTIGISKIYNDEVSWSAGAFNLIADASSSADYGWGDYNFGNNQVVGTRIFAIKLRNETYKKLEIQSLISGVYTFRFADLDGNNEVTTTIDKADYPAKTLAYYSIENETALDLEPTDWDMVFTRYVTPLNDGSGGIIDYTLTGVLTDVGVQVVQADGIDPTTIDYLDYTDDYSDSLTIIGYDWKSFQGSWVIEAERVYFVKTANEKIWKIQFFDFEGSSTGTTTLEKTLIDGTSSTSKVTEHFSSFNVFPNPASDVTNLVFEVKTYEGAAQIQIINQLGQRVYNENIEIHNGLNAKQLSLNFPSGLYHVALQIGSDFITRPLFIK